MVDTVYIAAAAHDGRFSRTCVASVRRLYPKVPIRLLVGGPLEAGLELELRRYWAVEPAELPRQDWGWGFIKLEPLFRPPGERFLVLDSDTVMTGPVLRFAQERDDDFIVDDEQQSAERARAIYYDPARAGAPEPAFLFNTGQWFGRSGVLGREHFRGLVEWGRPPRLVTPSVFKNGDQGVLNLVVNEQTRLGRVRTARVPLMRWPGHGMAGLDAASVARGSCPPVVVHWAGMSRMPRRRIPGADVLAYFERRYYERLPLGAAWRLVNRGRDALGRAGQTVVRASRSSWSRLRG
jgi:hypothetical protein